MADSHSVSVVAEKKKQVIHTVAIDNLWEAVAEVILPSHFVFVMGALADMHRRTGVDMEVTFVVFDSRAKIAASAMADTGVSRSNLVGSMLPESSEADC